MNKFFKPIKTIIDDFAFLEQWEEKYQYIIDLGRELSLPTNIKVQKISGCVSNVWLGCKKERNLIHIYLYSDALIVRGILAIIMSLYSGKTIDEIQKIDFKSVFALLGLNDHLSVSRSNGVFSIIRTLKSLV